MRRPMSFVTVLAAVFAFAVLLKEVQSEDKPKSPSEFAKSTIDLGLVVRDIDQSVKFYTEAVGFKEAPGFAVPGAFCKDAGLTDGSGLKIRVMVLGEGESATKLKLVEAVDAKVPAGKTDFIESQSGYRYLTIYVTSNTAANERLAKAGLKPLSKGPVAIPGNLYLTCVKDPDGNLLELIGPKK